MILYQFFKSQGGLKFTVFLSFFLLSMGYAQPFTLTYGDSSPHYINLSDSLPIFIDDRAHVTIQQILERSASTEASLFSTAVSHKNSPRFFPIAVWSKIALHNASLQDVHGYLRTCNLADSVYVYEVQNGRVAQLHKLRAAQATFNKPVPFSTSMYPVSVSPHHTRTFYFCVYFNKNPDSHHYQELFYHSQKSSLQGLIKNYSVQLFYGGAMFIFTAFGLVLFVLFKDYKFLIFSALELSFVWYFWESNGVISAFLGYQSNLFHIYVSLSFLILSIGFLVITHAHLSQYFPRLTRKYATLTLLLAFLPYFLRAVNLSAYYTSLVHNISVIVWAVFSVILVTTAARRQNKEARLLARALLVLLICAVIYILPLSGFSRNTAWTHYSLQAGSLLFSSLLFYGLFSQVNALRQKHQKAQKLERLKSEFLANIAHEFKTPLSLIMAPAQQLSKRTQSPANAELIALVQSNARKLQIYIDQLLDLAKLESDQTQIKAQPVALIKVIDNAVQMFQSYAERKNIKLHWEKNATPQIMVWGDPQMLQSVFENLIGNALKFTERGAVMLSLKANDDTIEVEVKDSGKGIPEEELPHIFNRFFSGAEHREMGSGIGLAMVQNLLHLHQAQINVVSSLGAGATFTVKFKKGKNHFSNSPLNMDTPENRDAEEQKRVQSKSGMLAQSPAHLEKSAEPDDIVLARDNPLQKPHLLVVDDNWEMRRYLRQALEESYFITEAANGKEGIEQAQKHMPDLLISDMVMPEMDGLTFCKKLKKDVKTSHIPILFLTASSSQQDKLQGLQYGADDYLTKPFDIEELQLRLANFLRKRDTLKAKFKNQAHSLPSENLGTTDFKFLKRVNLIIDQNLNDTEFGIARLSEKIKLSPAQLNRKLKALTGFSSNRYLQHVKLTKAYHLLQNQESNVSEVAFETGFSSTAYFVKCFREKFGQTPGSLLT